MRTFVLGTAGHVDHGKTTVVRALTGIDTDRWREEKERGLTIDIGFAHLVLGGDGGTGDPDARSAASPDAVELGIVDVPGHADFIGNMLTGTTGLDTVLLVVSAAEGPMPQTTEHLQIAGLLGIREGVVALTNVDRVEPGFADLAEEAVRAELRRVLGRDDWPIVRVDAVSGEGIPALRQELAGLVGRLEPVGHDPIFRLPVDRSFSVAGTGTVVTGTAWTGVVETGDRLRVLPDGPEVRVRSLQVHGRDEDRVAARRRCAAGLVGATVEDVRRGVSLVSLDSWRPAERVGVAFRLLDDGSRLIEHGSRLRVWLGTREVMARIELSGRETAVPGDRGHAVLACEEPLVTRAGDRCILRFYSPVELLGGARVVELDPPRHWEGRTEAWTSVLDEDPGSSIEAAIRLAGGAGIDRASLALATPHPVPGALPAAWRARRIGERWFSPEALERLEARFEDWLRRAHAEAPRAPALPLESLRGAAHPEDAAELVQAAIDRMQSAGRVLVDGPQIRLADHAVKLSERERKVRDGLFREVEGAGLMPPDPAELAERVDASRGLVNDLLRLLVADGRIVRVTPELYLATDAEIELRARARAVLADHCPARPTDFGGPFGVTRRYLIPLLEYLDGIDWTRRTEAGRIPGPAMRMDGVATQGREA